MQRNGKLTYSIYNRIRQFVIWEFLGSKDTESKEVRSFHGASNPAFLKVILS